MVVECKICGSIFNEKRFLKDLFRTKEFHVCDECFKKYPFEIEYNYFPLDNHMLEVVSLFKKDNNIDYGYFTEEYSEIYKTILKSNENKLLIHLNIFYVSDEILTDYSHISTLLDKEIIILTNILIV